MIPLKQKLNPLWWFKNDDDPHPPDWYLPNDSELKRRIWWMFRNPLHNFTFYVIGISDVEFIRKGMYPSDVFNPTGRGWNFCYIYRHKSISVYIIGGICLLMCIYCAYKERYLFGLFFAMLTSLFGWLPFISYVGRLKFYFGVRERGNWGWKLTRK